MAVAEAPAFGPDDWLAIREACPVLLLRLSPSELSSRSIATTLSAPELVPVAANLVGAGTVGVLAAPFSAPPLSLLSLEMP